MAFAWSRLLIYSVVGAFLLAVQAEASARSMSVRLNEFTEIDLYLPPDLGTRLIFPFNLDGVNADPPLYVQLTNSGDQGVFATHREPNQNSILIYLKVIPEDGVIPEYRGNLFLSVAGFHLTVNLKSSSNLRKHLTDVRFVLNPKKRRYIIDSLLQRFTQKQDNDSDQYVELSALWKNIGQMMWAPRAKKNIKERFKKEGFVIDIDRMDLYDGFALLHFNIKGNNAPPTLASLSSSGQSFETQFWCQRRQCRLYINNDSVFQYEPLEFSLEVDTKSLLLKW